MDVKRYIMISVFVMVVVLVGAGGWYLWARDAFQVAGESPVPRYPQISPDYGGVTLPPNIAPVNFVVREEGERFVVRIAGDKGNAIGIRSRSPETVIPSAEWRALLEANRGRDIGVDVYAAVGRRWYRYKRLLVHIAEDEIDSHLVYRVTGSVYFHWGEIEVCQRDLTSYDVSPIFNNRSFDNGCVNCHSFANNDPQRMAVSTRSPVHGNAALVVADDEADKVNATFGYTAWHPSGRLLVYSINKVRQFFHTTGQQVRDVIDLDAALACYSLQTKAVQMLSNAADKNRLESYPTWSPDGHYLYYCSAPFLWTDRDSRLPERYAEVRYDLMRIAYDEESARWGQPETVLSASETGLSILQPRISPDGRFLLCCMCDYGCFPTYRPSSNLYLLNLETGQYRPLDINSNTSESWHSWSSNSRWIAFSSKRRDGVFTRCYLSYIDSAGQAAKPFVVPQQDPRFYDTLVKAISVPELVTGAVPVDSTTLVQLARSTQSVEVDAITGPTVMQANSIEYQSGSH